VIHVVRAGRLRELAKRSRTIQRRNDVDSCLPARRVHVHYFGQTVHCGLLHFVRKDNENDKFLKEICHRERSEAIHVVREDRLRELAKRSRTIQRRNDVDCFVASSSQRRRGGSSSRGEADAVHVVFWIASPSVRKDEERQVRRFN